MLVMADNMESLAAVTTVVKRGTGHANTKNLGRKMILAVAMVVMVGVVAVVAGSWRQ